VLEIHLSREDDQHKLIHVFEYKNGKPTSTTEYTSEDNLPEDIHVKLSALKLVTPPDDVDKIGQRVSDNVFWIYE
jgi:hypothetical protein